MMRCFQDAKVGPAARVTAAVTTAVRAMAAVSVTVAMIAGTACETRESLTKARIRETERGLLRAVYLKGLRAEKLSLTARMPFYKVPAVSIAVMNGNALEWARAYGVRETQQTSAATPETIFEAGDLAQPVMAAAALLLAREGRLDLDADVNSRLRRWKVPSNAFTAKKDVTIREILMHTAGFPDRPLPGYPPGRKTPSLAEILSGKTPEAPSPAAPEFVPGTDVRPSAIGFAVLEELIEDVTSQAFPEFMAKTVLVPAGMTSSTFAFPLPPVRAAAAAAGHQRDGRALEGKWLDYPAGGFWTTPSDLMKLTAELLRTAAGAAGRVLTPEEARSMFTPQAPGRGLGFAVDGTGTDVRVHLRGRASGYTCSLDVYPYKGQGAVVMTNSDNGFLLTDEILRALSAAYEWPDYKPEERPLLRLDPSLYPAYTGRYEITPDYFLDVTYEDYYLVIRPTGQAPTKFYVENPTFFFSIDPYIRIQFLTDAKGRVTGLLLWQQDFKQEAKKIG